MIERCGKRSSTPGCVGRINGQAPKTGSHLPAPPQSVRVVRTLGHGRAAQAQLVEATMDGGRVIRCVEKVFAPGLLTRLIYRFSFQAPFAYQSNEHAIRACFYRRRVAAAVFRASDVEVGVAAPLYVRFDRTRRAWVLAAEWIDGRGIRPAPPDPNRIARRLRSWSKTASTGPGGPVASAEVQQLVDVMHDLEAVLAECGLYGSGWQVAPRAMVSTANLLRVDDRYTVIDLESGIPAVLVGRYLRSAARRGAVPPFDDLDPGRLRQWYRENERLIVFRIGPEAAQRLGDDIESLIFHSSEWKNSEWAAFRQPWRHVTASGRRQYQRECRRRWLQDGITDSITAAELASQPLKMRAIWWAGILPTRLGRYASMLIGNREYRESVQSWLRDPALRRRRWRATLQDYQQRWTQSGRLPAGAELGRYNWPVHFLVRLCTPVKLHRLLIDRTARRNAAITIILLLFCPRYQSWFGWRRVEAAIERWRGEERISIAEASRLREDLCGHAVRAYTRGFAGHLALKTLAPLILPAKVGGLAAFLASGNVWFLLPILSTPLLRTAITLANAWSTRVHNVPHAEALAVGWLPIVGSVAFPLQMFASRPALSTFLIRDAASKLGRRIPIYGGSDSRTEIALIRATDELIEVMEAAAGRLRSLFRWFASRWRTRSTTTGVVGAGKSLTASAPGPLNESALGIHSLDAFVEASGASAPKTQLARWLDHQAAIQIRRELESLPSDDRTKRVAA